MTPKEISKLIEKEINGDWSTSNAHNCDLKRCLIRPKKRKLLFSIEFRDAWIVLEEKPETLEGYKIYFDEENKKFGLAGQSGSLISVYNSHDTFLEAFKSM